MSANELGLLKFYLSIIESLIVVVFAVCIQCLMFINLHDWLMMYNQISYMPGNIQEVQYALYLFSMFWFVKLLHNCIVLYCSSNLVSSRLWKKHEWKIYIGEKWRDVIIVIPGANIAYTLGTLQPLLRNLHDWLAMKFK